METPAPVGAVDLHPAFAHHFTCRCGMEMTWKPYVGGTGVGASGEPFVDYERYYFWVGLWCLHCGNRRQLAYGATPRDCMHARWRVWGKEWEGLGGRVGKASDAFWLLLAHDLECVPILLSIKSPTLCDARAK